MEVRESSLPRSLTIDRFSVVQTQAHPAPLISNEICGIESYMNEMSTSPLSGIRIVDLTIWQQGPVATTMLADLGAEVIKIEECEKGDPGRGIMSMAGAATAKGLRNFYFEANNRHKKSVTLNLKTAEGRQIAHRLVERS